MTSEIYRNYEIRIDRDGSQVRISVYTGEGQAVLGNFESRTQAANFIDLLGQKSFRARFNKLRGMAEGEIRALISGRRLS